MGAGESCGKCAEAYLRPPEGMEKPSSHTFQTVQAAPSSSSASFSAAFSLMTNAFRTFAWRDLMRGMSLKTRAAAWVNRSSDRFSLASLFAFPKSSKSRWGVHTHGQSGAPASFPVDGGHVFDGRGQSSLGAAATKPGSHSPSSEYRPANHPGSPSMRGSTAAAATPITHGTISAVTAAQRLLFADCR